MQIDFDISSKKSFEISTEFKNNIHLPQKQFFRSEIRHLENNNFVRSFSECIVSFFENLIDFIRALCFCNQKKKSITNSESEEKISTSEKRKSLSFERDSSASINKKEEISSSHRKESTLPQEQSFSKELFSYEALNSLTLEDEEEYCKKARENLIKNGTDINQLDLVMPPLSIAAHRGLLKVMELFLEFGGDVNAREKTALKRTPLMCALLRIKCETSNREIFFKIAIRLIEKGANPNSIFLDESAVYIAVENEGEELLQALLMKKADPNVGHSTTGETPLATILYKYKDFPSKEKLLRMAQALIMNGADINQKKGIFSGSILHYAIEIKWSEFIAWSVTNCSNIDLNVKDPEGKTPIAFLLKKLIGKNSKGQPKLFSIAQLFIDHGVNLDEGFLLHFVIKFGMIEVLEMMLKSKKVNLNLVNSEGLTPFAFATKIVSQCRQEAKAKYLQIQQMLMDAGAQ